MRPDQSSATVRLHYLTEGNANFAFTINRAEYFVPVALLLKGLAEVPPHLMLCTTLPAFFSSFVCRQACRITVYGNNVHV